MDQIKLSVIVPIYQVEAYLPRCIDSILAQTYRNFELILVNDGTKDNCPQIMAEYAAKDDRIRQIHKENGGLSSARNAGMKIARGKYIAFVDSDDYIAPELYADAIAEAERTGVELVVWNYQKAYDDRIDDAYLKMKDEVLDLDRLGLQNYYYKYWFPYRHGFEACNKLFRRDVIEQERLKFQFNHEILSEDLLFTSMYLMHTHKLAAMSKPYYYYYMRSNSIMNSAKPRAAHRHMTLAVRLYEYVNSMERGKELRDVMPVLCYASLIANGISDDPSMDDVYKAMAEYQQNKTMNRLLKELISPKPLLKYMLHTGKGQRMQFRARMFAMRWLRGDLQGAAALIYRGEK